jgi:putative peptidoglycan lipid II flippase
VVKARSGGRGPSPGDDSVESGGEAACEPPVTDDVATRSGEVDAPARSGGAARRMSVATAASRGVGFVRIWVLAAVLGTTYLGNTYQSSNSVSNILFELVAAGALSAVLVPTFAEHFRRNEQAEAERLAGGVLGFALAVMGVVTVVGMIFAPAIARLLTAGVSNPDVRSQQIALSTFLLRFMIPQVLLYAVGTVATAVLFAKRRFVIAAVAPIANTIVITLVMLVFRSLHGDGGGLDLTLTEKLVLGIGATLGVVGFTGVPTIAVMRSGFRLRPRLGAVDKKLRHLLFLSAWVALQPDVAVLLLSAMVMGNRVPGGVIAYQFCMVAFLAPYAILALPIHTTLLPELSHNAADGDTESFAGRLRWGLDGIAITLIPVGVAFIALARPVMDVIAPSSTKGDVELFAAMLAALGMGLFTYGTFLLLARAFYALDDSRTPAIVAGSCALVGAAVMVVGGLSAQSDVWKVAFVGIGHSTAYLLGTLVLGVLLRRRLGRAFFPHVVWKVLPFSIALGLLAWWVERLVAPRERLATLAVLAAIGLVGLGAYVAMLRMLPERGRRFETAFEPTDPDLAAPA